MAAGNPIDIQDGIDTSGFYFQLGVAQVFLKVFTLNLKYLLMITSSKNYLFLIKHSYKIKIVFIIV